MEPFIQPFKTNDYRAIVTILRAAVPEVSTSEEKLRNHYSNRDPMIKFQRWVVIFDGGIVAYGCYDQLSQSYNPREFDIYGAVHPDYQFKGIGSVLYNRIIAALSQFHPLLVRAYALQNESRSVEFLKARGFQEIQQGQHEWTLSLDVLSCDPTPYIRIEEALQNLDIKIKTLQELVTDPNYDHKLYELYNELKQDVPLSGPSTSFTYDYFITKLLKDPNLLPEAYFVAVKGNEYIGMNVLYAKPEMDCLFNEFTGVKQDYSHKGIALAIKLSGITYAKAHGYKTIKTSNNSKNDRIL